MRVHLVGASGSGTTTLGRALAARRGIPHFDTDDYFWLPSEPPFQHIRERGERQGRLGAALRAQPDWVLSGSLCGWGDIFIPLFGLVVFLWVPPDVRIARLRARERARYGDAIAPGGPLRRTTRASRSPSGAGGCTRSGWRRCPVRSSASRAPTPSRPIWISC